MTFTNRGKHVVCKSTEYKPKGQFYTNLKIPDIPFTPCSAKYATPCQ